LNEFSIGSLSVAPGTRTAGTFPVARRGDGSVVGIPLVIIHGVEPGPVCCVDAGTHGDEHEGAHAILTLINLLEPTKLRGTFVGTMALNLPATEALQRGNPFDHWMGDLNRLFPGAEGGNLTQRIAHAYTEHIARDASFVISIHSGASYIYWSPLVMCGGHPPSIELAKALGHEWNIIGQSEGISGASHDVFAQRGIPAVAIEVGGAGERVLETFRRNVDLAAGAILNAMRHHAMIEGQPKRASSWTFVRNRAVRSGHGGLLVPVEDFPLRRHVRAGTLLMRMYDLFGEEIEEVRAPFDSLVMGFRSFPYSPPGWPLVWLSEITHTVRE